MAKIIVSKTNIEQEMIRLKERKRKGIIQIGIGLLISFFLAKPLTPLIFLGGMVYFFTVASQAKLLSIYLQKEKNTGELFKGLSNKYNVLCDAAIKVDGKKKKWDYILVGPDGVFVIRSKNLDGTIYGNEDDKEWTQERMGKKGEKNTAQFSNPIKELFAQLKNLSILLENNEIKVDSKGIVYFLYPEVKLQLKTEKTPVFIHSRGNKEIINFTRKNNDQKLTSEQISSITDTIIKETSLNDEIR